MKNPMTNLLGWGALALLLLPCIALAESNPHHDPKTLDGGLIKVCEELSIAATSTTATLTGTCNITTKTSKGDYDTSTDSISLDSDIDDLCYKWIELHFLADRVDIAAGCYHPDPNQTHTRNGVVLKNTVESRGKLDDMVTWDPENKTFSMKPKHPFFDND